MAKHSKAVLILALVGFMAQAALQPVPARALRPQAAADRGGPAVFDEDRSFAGDKVERLVLPGIEATVVRSLLAEYERPEPGEAGQKKSDLSTPDEINEVQEHALCVAATASRLLAIEEGVPLDGEEAKRMFIIGLLHDVGRAGFDPVTTQKIVTVINAHNETAGAREQIPLQREEFIAKYPDIAPEDIRHEAAKMAGPVLESAGLRMTDRVKLNLGLILDHEWRSADIVRNRARRIDKIIAAAGVSIDPDMLEVIKFHYDPIQYLMSLGYKSPREVKDARVLRNFRMLQIIAASDAFAGRNSRKKGRIYYKHPRESLLEYTFIDSGGALRRVEGAFTRLARYRDEGMISAAEFNTLLDIVSGGELDDVIAVARDVTSDQQPEFVKTRLREEKTALARQENCSETGIDGNLYRKTVIKISPSKRRDTDRRLSLLKRAIHRRVAARGYATVSGNRAVYEVEWLLNQLIKRSNCSDRLFMLNMPPHMREMRRITEMLCAELGIRPSTALLIAAMLHDADRFFEGNYVRIREAPRNNNPRHRNYHKSIQHPQLAAEFVAPLLQMLGIDKAIIKEVDLLVRNHETGIREAVAREAAASGRFRGARMQRLMRDSGLLKDADSVSLFTPVLLTNVLTVENLGRPEKLRIEVDQKYNRCDQASQRVIDRMMRDREAEYRATKAGNVAYEVFLSVRRGAVQVESFGEPVSVIGSLYKPATTANATAI